MLCHSTPTAHCPSEPVTRTVFFVEYLDIVEDMCIGGINVDAALLGVELIDCLTRWIREYYQNPPVGTNYMCLSLVT